MERQVEKGQPEVTNEVLEDALKALLKSNLGYFNIVCACFYGKKKQAEYFNIATKVFKEYWNELYNSVIAYEIWEKSPDLYWSEKRDFFSESK